MTVAMKQHRETKDKIDTKRTGGRPRKDKYDQRRHHHKVSYNDEEEAIIQMKASEYQYKDDRYLHDIGLAGVVRSHLSEENTEQLRDVCGMANNTNQIAHAAHTDGLEQLKTESLRLVEMLYDLVRRILRGGDLSEPVSDDKNV